MAGEEGETKEKKDDDASTRDGGEVSKTAGAGVKNTSSLPSKDDDPVWPRFKQLRNILVDGISIDLYLDFLYRNNKADLLLILYAMF